MGLLEIILLRSDMNRLEAKLKIGTPKKRHGGYSYLTSHRIPEDKIYLERYLTNLRENYIADLGENETKLGTGAILLLDTLITLKAVNRIIEIETGRDGNLMRLDERYNARNNQIIKICLALGIDKNDRGSEITADQQAILIKADLEGKDNE